MKLKADPTKKEKKHINVLLLLMILILAGLLTGIAGEGLYELNVSRRSLKGGNTIGAEEIESSYIQISDTVLMEEKTDDEVQMFNLPKMAVVMWIMCCFKLASSSVTGLS